MDDFSTPGTTNSFGVPASPANYIEPGKMPMSSMNPALVVDANDNAVLASGASGGTRITTATAWVSILHLYRSRTTPPVKKDTSVMPTLYELPCPMLLCLQISMHALWFGMQANEATDSYRLHHQLVPNEINYEPDFNPVSLMHPGYHIISCQAI